MALTVIDRSTNLVIDRATDEVIVRATYGADIDTEERLRSVHGYTPGAAILPVTTGTIDNADVYTVGWIYSGSSPSGAPPAVVPAATYYLVLMGT